MQLTDNSTKLLVVARCAPNEVDLIASRNACALSLSVRIIRIIRELLVEQYLEQLFEIRLSFTYQCSEPVC